MSKTKCLQKLSQIMEMGQILFPKEYQRLSKLNLIILPKIEDGKSIRCSLAVTNSDLIISENYLERCVLEKALIGIFLEEMFHHKTTDLNKCMPYINKRLNILTSKSSKKSVFEISLYNLASDFAAFNHATSRLSGLIDRSKLHSKTRNLNFQKYKMEDIILSPYNSNQIVEKLKITKHLKRDLTDNMFWCKLISDILNKDGYLEIDLPAKLKCSKIIIKYAKSRRRSNKSNKNHK